MVMGTNGGKGEGSGVPKVDFIYFISLLSMKGYQYHDMRTPESKVSGVWYMAQGFHMLSNFSNPFLSSASSLACTNERFILFSASDNSNAGDFHALAIACFAAIINKINNLC